MWCSDEFAQSVIDKIKLLPCEELETIIERGREDFTKKERSFVNFCYSSLPQYVDAYRSHKRYPELRELQPHIRVLPLKKLAVAKNLLVLRDLWYHEKTPELCIFALKMNLDAIRHIGKNELGLWSIF